MLCYTVNNVIKASLRTINERRKLFSNRIHPVTDPLANVYHLIKIGIFVLDYTVTTEHIKFEISIILDQHSLEVPDFGKVKDKATIMKTMLYNFYNPGTKTRPRKRT